MHDHDKREPDDVDMLRRMGYENRDISLGTIAKFVIALFVLIGVTGVVTFGIYMLLVNSAWERNKEWPLRTVGELKSIPQPVLQAHPIRDMTQFQKREDAKLEKQGFAPVPGIAVQTIPENVVQTMEQRYSVPRRTQGSEGSGSDTSAPRGADHAGGETR